MEYFNDKTSKELTLVATLRAKYNKIEELQDALLSLMDKTRAEKGSISYHLYADLEDPQNFIFHETWASEELWKEHMESAHIKNFFAHADVLLDREPKMERWERSVAPNPVIAKNSLVLFAYNQAKEGKRDEWEKILTDLIAPTLAEKGALHYELHRNRDHKNDFMFHETWATVDSWLEHMKAPHLIALLKIINNYTLNGITVVKARVID